jgi:AcrR family transcriptional regulator
VRTRDTQKLELVKQKAIELCVEEGLEGFSVNKLARACKISVATLYIYYKDKDDLIMQIAAEEGQKMTDILMKGFDPELPFAEGLRIQWKNRLKYMTENPKMGMFFDQLRSSSYQNNVERVIFQRFKTAVSAFMNNAMERGEIDRMPVEVYWSIAVGPLYTLIRFQQHGHNLSGKPFKMTNKMVWQLFDLVIKSLLKKKK